MDRREFLYGATTGVAAMTLARAAAAQAEHAEGGHHSASHGAVDKRILALREATLDCQDAAAECIRHCVAELASGDTTLARCLESVLRVQAVSRATHAIAASDAAMSPRTRDLAAVCADFCNDCAGECEPHAEKHPSCQACLEACRRCVEACDAYAA